MGKKHFKVKSSFLFSSINKFFLKSMHIIGNVNINAKPVFSLYYISREYRATMEEEHIM